MATTVGNAFKFPAIPEPYSSALSASANFHEDWTKLSDLAERRRIQNRIAQRNYRKKIKRRLEDLEQKAKSSSVLPEQLDPGLATTGGVGPRNQGHEETERRQTTGLEVGWVVPFEKSKKPGFLAQEHTDTPHNRGFAQSSNEGGRIWTEITKDLVSDEAIKTVGYESEETDDFFYVMDYLSYDDILRLVEVSEDLKRVRDESYLPDYDFEMNEDFQKSAGPISSGFSSRSRDSTKPTTVSSAPTSRSVSPDTASFHSPLASSKSKSKDEGVRCAECGAVFIGFLKRSNLLRHYRFRHPAKRLWCPERDCNASFFEKSQWKAHLDAAHTSAKEPLCWKHNCNGRQFDTVDILFEHLREMSIADPCHGCLICGAEFPTENARDRHISYEACYGQSEVPVLQVTRPYSSCLSCRRYKLKCDGKVPSCIACTRHGVASTCSYQKKDLFQRKKRSDPVSWDLLVGDHDRDASAKTSIVNSRAGFATTPGASRKVERTHHLAINLENPFSVNRHNRSTSGYLDALISVFDGRKNIIESIPADTMLPYPLQALKQSLHVGLSALKDARENAIKIHGASLSDGDDTATRSLQSISAQLDQATNRYIQNARERKNIEVIMHLVDATDSARQQSIKVIDDLCIRISSPTPVPQNAIDDRPVQAQLCHDNFSANTVSDPAQPSPTLQASNLTTAEGPSLQATAKQLDEKYSAQRKASDKAVQKAFRQHKEQYLKDIETKVEDLARASEASAYENDRLRAHVDQLNSELRHYKDLGLNGNGVFAGKSPSVPLSGHPDDSGSDTDSLGSVSVSTYFAVTSMPTSWGSSIGHDRHELAVNELGELELLTHSKISGDKATDKGVDDAAANRPMSGVKQMKVGKNIDQPKSIADVAPSPSSEGAEPEREAPIGCDIPNEMSVSVGCQSCRLSKIHCDLISPQCGPCKSKGLFCQSSDEAVSSPMTIRRDMLAKELTELMRNEPLWESRQNMGYAGTKDMTASIDISSVAEPQKLEPSADCDARSSQVLEVSKVVVPNELLQDKPGSIIKLENPQAELVDFPVLAEVKNGDSGTESVHLIGHQPPCPEPDLGHDGIIKRLYKLTSYITDYLLAPHLIIAKGLQILLSFMKRPNTSANGDNNGSIEIYSHSTRQPSQFNTLEADGAFTHKVTGGTIEQRTLSLLSQKSKESCNFESTWKLTRHQSEDPIVIPGTGTVVKQRPEGENQLSSVHSHLQRDNQNLIELSFDGGTKAFPDPKTGQFIHLKPWNSTRNLDDEANDKRGKIDDKPNTRRTSGRIMEQTGVPRQMLGEYNKYAESLDGEDRFQVQSSHGAAVPQTEVMQLPGTALPRGFANVSIAKSSLIDRIKQYIENFTQESWDWWPLKPCHRSVEPGLVRLQWYCALGHKHATDIAQADVRILGGKIERCSKQQRSELLPQPQSTASITTVADSATGSSSESVQRSDSQSSSSRSSSATSDGDASDLPDDDSDPDRGQEPDSQGSRPHKDVALNIIPPSHLKGFVLFGVHGSKRLRRGKIRMAQIDVEVHKDDDSFFEEMAVQYKKLRGYMRWIFSIWCFRTCEFVMYHKANPNEILAGPPELPSLANTDYLFNPTHHPQILEKVFATNFYGCKPACIKAHLDILCLLHECHGRNYCGKHRVLERLPRRRRKWEIDRDEETDEAWGLNAVYGISFFKLVVYHCLVFAAPVVFWILWIRKAPGDWQNASVPFFAAAVVLSLFWLPFAYRAEEKRGKMKIC